MSDKLYRKPRSADPARSLSPAGKKTQIQLELRAKWIANEWNRDARVTYPQMIARVRKRFGIGESMAEVAYARAREIVAANVTDFDVGRLWSKFLQISDEARADKKYAAATKALYTGAVATGMIKPKLDVHHTGKLTISQQAHVAVLHLTPIERGHRQQELEERAGLLGMASETIEQLVDDALAAVSSEQGDVAQDLGASVGSVIDVGDLMSKVPL